MKEEIEGENYARSIYPEFVDEIEKWNNAEESERFRNAVRFGSACENEMAKAAGEALTQWAKLIYRRGYRRVRCRKVAVQTFDYARKKGVSVEMQGEKNPDALISELIAEYAEMIFQRLSLEIDALKGALDRIKNSRRYQAGYEDGAESIKSRMWKIVNDFNYGNLDTQRELIATIEKEVLGIGVDMAEDDD